MAKIKYETDGFAAATKTDLRNVQRDTWGFAGKFWHRNYKAVKFTKRGARLYKYAPRSGEPGSGKRFKGSYSHAKLLRRINGQGVRAIGEVKPLVWSGQSRASAMAAKKVVAKAQSAGRGYVDIIINAPALNFKNAKSRTNPRKDVTSITVAEEQVMSKVSARRFEKRLLRIRRRKTVRR